MKALANSGDAGTVLGDGGVHGGIPGGGVPQGFQKRSHHIGEAAYLRESPELVCAGTRSATCSACGTLTAMVTTGRSMFRFFVKFKRLA